MRKFLSIFLSLALVCSIGTTAFAANETSASTSISYIGTGTATYEVEIPESMAPGETGTVSVTGNWSATSTLSITCDESVTMTDSKSGATKDLAITFGEISKTGDNSEEVTASADVSVESMDELFGEWTGTFDYTISLSGSGSTGDDTGSDSGTEGDTGSDGSTDDGSGSTDVELITFNITSSQCKAEDGMTWGEWLESDYSIDTFGLSGNYVKNNVSGMYLALNSVKVRKDDKILPNTTYYFIN